MKLKNKTKEPLRNYGISISLLKDYIINYCDNNVEFEDWNDDFEKRETKEFIKRYKLRGFIKLKEALILLKDYNDYMCAGWLTNSFDCLESDSYVNLIKSKYKINKKDFTRWKRSDKKTNSYWKKKFYLFSRLKRYGYIKSLKKFGKHRFFCIPKKRMKQLITALKTDNNVPIIPVVHAFDTEARIGDRVHTKDIYHVLIKEKEVGTTNEDKK